MTDETNVAANRQLSAVAAALNVQTAASPGVAGTSVLSHIHVVQGRKVFPTVFQETNKPQ